SAVAGSGSSSGRAAPGDAGRTAASSAESAASELTSASSSSTKSGAGVKQVGSSGYSWVTSLFGTAEREETIEVVWSGEILEMSDGVDVFLQKLKINKLPPQVQIRSAVLWKVKQEGQRPPGSREAHPGDRLAPPAYFSELKTAVDALYTSRHAPPMGNARKRRSRRL
ncbi:unnamed protein product, partial [Amoebophrya sp. A25]